MGWDLRTSFDRPSDLGMAGIRLDFPGLHRAAIEDPVVQRELTEQDQRLPRIPAMGNKPTDAITN